MPYTARLESISFLFVTATSGSIEKLIERAKLADKKMVVNQALQYYAHYLIGSVNKGPELICVDFKLKKPISGMFTDCRTPDHYDADTVDIDVDMPVLEDLTKWAGKDDPADTLTAALIVYEQIIDALEVRLSIGRFDSDAKGGKGGFDHLVPKQFKPFYDQSITKKAPVLQMRLH